MPSLTLLYLTLPDHTLPIPLLSDRLSYAALRSKGRDKDKERDKDKDMDEKSERKRDDLDNTESQEVRDRLHMV